MDQTTLKLAFTRWEFRAETLSCFTAPLIPFADFGGL